MEEIMYHSDILLPLIAMAFLSFIAWIKMFITRFRESKQANIAMDDMHAFNKELPKKFITSGDNYRNLFEIPVLFYVFVLIIMNMRIDDNIYLALAWTYVGFRYLHTIIHISYSKVSHRFFVYFFSCITLWGMWGRLVFELF